jgi:hypothetical protein
MMKAHRFSITMPPATLAQVAARQAWPEDEQSTDRSSVIAKSLNRYFYALDSARRALRSRLSEGEQGLILDALNGTLFSEPFSVGIIEHEIADALADGYAVKWSVDGPALVVKLKALSYCEKLAIVDAAERWWNRVARGEHPAVGEMLDYPHTAGRMERSHDVGE